MQNRQFLREKWPFRWWGYNGLEAIATPQPLVAGDIVDFDWNPPDKARIVAYLNSATPLLMTLGLPESCGLCDELVNPNEDMSDDVWMWPSRLGHDVEMHGAYLPDAMVEHIRRCDYRPLACGGRSMEAYPFPLRDVERLGFRLSDGALTRKE